MHIARIEGTCLFLYFQEKNWTILNFSVHHARVTFQLSYVLSTRAPTLHAQNTRNPSVLLTCVGNAKRNSVIVTETSLIVKVTHL